VPGLFLDNTVAMFCGGACVVVAGLAVLSLVSLLGARNGDAAAERASAFAISLISVGLSLAALWGAAGGLEAIGGGALRFLTSFGLPPAILPVQASIAALVIAFFAWRFPKR
jgi:hypothetical protein